MLCTPLVLPIHIDPALPTAKDGQLCLPLRPTHIASWTIPSSSSTGPLRRVALAGLDNTIWITTAPLTVLPSPSAPPPSHPLPIILTPDPDDHSPTPSTSVRKLPRPAGQSRKHSHTQLSGRPRASSSASSILSSSSAQRRRVSAFSPPPSAHPIPTATFSSATAQVAPPEFHASHLSPADRTELLDSLREQATATTTDERPLGLGIVGLGRRGLPGVHGKEEHESGTASPRSNGSQESSRTFSSRLREWTKGEDGKDEELLEKMEEVEVEREMELESREERRGSEERRVIQEAMGEVTPRGERGEPPWQDEREWPVIRVVLRRCWVGKITEMRVIKEVGGLCVLRDTGILDVISLETLELVQSINLEEDRSSPIASSSKRTLKIAPFWYWRALHVAQDTDSVMLVASGIPWPCAMPNPNGEVTRVVMLIPTVDGPYEISASFDLPGEGSIGVCRSGDSNYLIHATPTSLTSYPIHYPSTPPSQPPSRSSTPKPSAQNRAISSNFPSTPFPRPSTPAVPNLREPAIRRNRSLLSLRDTTTSSSGDTTLPKPEKGFAKFLAARRADWQGTKGKEDSVTEKVGIGEGVEVIRDGYGEWKAFRLDADGNGIGISDDAVHLFHCDGKTLSVRGTLSADNYRVLDAVCTKKSQLLGVRTEKRTIMYSCSVDAEEKFTIAEVKSDKPCDVIGLHDGDNILAASSSGLHDLGGPQASTLESLLMFTRPEEAETHMLIPHGMEHIFTADGKGNITTRSLLDFVMGRSSLKTPAPTVDRFDSPVTCMRAIFGGHRSRPLMVAGDEDGVVRIWDASSFELLGSWTLFAAPVEGVIVLEVPEAGPIRQCLLCTSREGTIGIISLEDMEQRYLIPASRAPLRRIFVGGRDILLAYANGKARVWNTETCEFRRSTGLDAADDMLQSGEWAEILFEPEAESSPLSSMCPVSQCAADTGRLLNLDLHRLGDWMVGPEMVPPVVVSVVLRALLSLCLTWDVDPSIDEICISKLKIPRYKRSAVFAQTGLASFPLVTGKDIWKVSSAATGQRQLAIVSLLRPFLDDSTLEPWAAKSIAFYTASLPDDTVEPDLDFFAAYYLDPAHDVQQAARLLFAARLDRMVESEIEAIVATHQADLPCTAAADKFGMSATTALTMIGGMALYKYQAISPSALKSVAESIALFLHDPACPHIALAIELCSKGFSTWQSYVDPMDLLRCLFHFATHKESHATQSGASLAAQARLAVLHIASMNPAVFMSTLAMDIMDAKTVDGRNSIMKLCLFMARKKPEVLEHSLPRIAEAVVKSLDPNIGKMREDVWQAATVILNELVSAFTTIDFHSGTQRLAVGTREGAVIMYDLKSASRLYVLEPHHAPVSSVNFSPDGRRLLTVSLDDGNVTIWKVGSSLSGFFTVGGPPNQSAAKGQPFKRITFKRADEGPLSSTTALSDVLVSWPGARQARVVIKETALTFET